jgi:hypothetical protein
MPAIATEAPKSRYFQFKANEKAKNGAFNGTCLVYPGDTFFMVIPVVKITKPDGSVELSETRMPTWADPIGEYEVPRPPRLIKSEPREARSFAEMNGVATAKVMPEPVPLQVAHAVQPMPAAVAPSAQIQPEPALLTAQAVADRMAAVRAARKPKGRPKGSKNKPKVDASTEPVPSAEG